MLIDWFTVAAQLVNFFILVFLLKRFLFEPIVDHMNEREEKIKRRLRQASEKDEEAERTIEKYRHKEKELEKQSEETLRQAEREAQERKKELLDQARQEVEKKRQDWVRSVDQERHGFSRELKKRTGMAVVEVARRALQDLADEALEDQLADTLLERLESLDEEAADKLGQACNEEITVRSTFELAANSKRKLTAALHRICGKQTEVIYQTDSDVPLEIEVSAGSVKVSWGIAGYLEELQSRVMDLIEEKTRSHEEPSRKRADGAENGNAVEAAGQEEEDG